MRSFDSYPVRGRREAAIKRSTAIKLILLGTGAAALVAATQDRVCHNDLGEEVSCRSSGRSSGSGAGSSSSRRAAQSTIARGGFGSSGLFGGG